jgi:hypothetical protein
MYAMAAMKTISAVQSFSRMPKMWWAGSMRSHSVHARPTV